METQGLGAAEISDRGAGTEDPTEEFGAAKGEQPIGHPSEALPGKQGTGAAREFKKELTARWRYLLRKKASCSHLVIITY